MAVRRLTAMMLLMLTACGAVLLASTRRLTVQAAEDSSQGFDPSNLDCSCKPCDDFFQFRVGGWLGKNPIPPEYPEWGSFITLADKNQQALREVLEAAAANKSAPLGSNEQKIGDYYASCMDTSTIDAQGVQPLSQELAAIDAIQDTQGLVNFLGHLQTRGVGVLFAFASDQDFKDSSQVIGEANQGGLGLPDRDYYTRTDEKSKKLRDDYVAHAAKLFTLVGDPQDKAAAEANTVLRIETSLAEASMNNVDLRDPVKVYHKMNLTDAQALTPHFSWTAFFEAVRAPKLTEINIGQPDFFKALDEMLGSVSLTDWKTYYRFHLIQTTARLLSGPFVQEDFNSTVAF